MIHNGYNMGDSTASNRHLALFYSITVYHLPLYDVITSKNLQISTCFLLLGLWSASHQGWSSDILENVFCIEQVCYVSCL